LINNNNNYLNCVVQLRVAKNDVSLRQRSNRQRNLFQFVSFDDLEVFDRSIHTNPPTCHRSTPFPMTFLIILLEINVFLDKIINNKKSKTTFKNK
jgi:hypothetical protein